MSKPKYKRGDRVQDRFKLPKPGAECVTGEVKSVAGDYILVEWDDGRTSEINSSLLTPEDTAGV